MIKTKEKLKEVLQIESKLYLGNKRRKAIELFFVNDKDWQIFRFQKALRYSEYHYNNRNNIIHKILYVIYRRRKNTLGLRLGIEIWENSFGPGLRIWHTGAIVVNGYAQIGDNCQLRGENCIGISRDGSGVPSIGNNVIIGNGAKILGDVRIQDNTVIGAGAVVVKNSDIDGDVLVGVPARSIRKG